MSWNKAIIISITINKMVIIFAGTMLTNMTIRWTSKTRQSHTHTKDRGWRRHVKWKKTIEKKKEAFQKKEESYGRKKEEDNWPNRR